MCLKISDFYLSSKERVDHVLNRNSGPKMHFFCVTFSKEGFNATQFSWTWHSTSIFMQCNSSDDKIKETTTKKNIFQKHFSLQLNLKIFICLLWRMVIILIHYSSGSIWRRCIHCTHEWCCGKFSLSHLVSLQCVVQQPQLVPAHLPLFTRVS